MLLQIKNFFRRNNNNTPLSNKNNNKTMATMIANNNNAAATFDDTSIDSERSTANTMEELVTDYLHYLQDRFESHLVGLTDNTTTTDIPKQHQWATFWLQEEAHVEAHHEEALAMLLLDGQQQDRIRSYLDNRKERTLNFLWSLCRDAMDENDDQKSVFHSFVDREEQLMKLYLVGYIQSSSKQ